MTHLLKQPSKQGIGIFFLWFRLLALAFVAVLALSGLKPISVWLLGIAIIYNTLLFIFRSVIFAKLTKYPYLIIPDVLLAFFLMLKAGVYESPYFLYTYGPLFVGSFLFGYLGAVVLAIIESALYVVTIYAGGNTPAMFAESGEHIGTYFLFYFIFAISTAYLADLLERLEKANEKKSSVELELEKARAHLETSLSMRNLSGRELQVLTLSCRGITIDDIALELGITQSTVKTYLNRAYEKLGVATKQEIIAQIMVREHVLE